MFDQLEIIENRYEQLNEMLSDPDVVSDSDKLREYSKEQSDLQKTVEVYREYKQKKETIEESRMMMNETDDKEMLEMLKEEISESEKAIPELENQLKLRLE